MCILVLSSGKTTCVQNFKKNNFINVSCCMDFEIYKEIRIYKQQYLVRMYVSKVVSVFCYCMYGIRKAVIAL